MKYLAPIPAIFCTIATLTPAAAQDANPDSVAEISGTCSSFGKTGQDFKSCDPSIVYIYVNGRGVFSAHKTIDPKTNTSLIMTFSGLHAPQPLSQPYDLVVDQLAFATVATDKPTILPASRKCTMS